MKKYSGESYPMLPVQHWWMLREKFKQSLPGVVTDNYLATVLNIQENSARINVMPFLKIIGLIDEEGKIQDLAKAWRDDEQYYNVCKKMRENIYPKELSEAVSNPSENRGAVERWFANRTGKGTSAVGRMSVFYITLFEGDISKKPELKVTKKEASKKKKKEIKKTEEKKLPDSITPIISEKSVLPSININLEIHISSDATPDQIDKIFESMAKHIYRK